MTTGPAPAQPTTADPHRQWLRALGERIRYARLDQDLTQDELADAAGLSRNCVSHTECGRGAVTVLRLARIAAALDLAPADLLGRLRLPPPPTTSPTPPSPNPDTTGPLPPTAA